MASTTLKTAITKGRHVWMPNMPMTLIAARNATATEPARATFRVLPKMTKHEVKEYLTQIYNLPVAKVNTANYDGKRKRVAGKRIVAYYKYRDWKKAIVSFDRETMVDLGEVVDAFGRPDEEELEEEEEGGEEEVMEDKK